MQLNLKVAPPTAHEEVETRAQLVAKTVDPTVMGLETAVRARFPKLRVRIDSLASRPTEHTWWIDEGTHSRWTTEKDVVVDQDGMLLQGKHVLHVASRIVGDVAAEDSTPFASSHVLTKNHLIATTLRGEVLAVELNAKAGAKPFRWQTPSGQGIATTPAVVDGDHIVAPVERASRDRADDSVQPGAVAAAGEDPDPGHERESSGRERAGFRTAGLH